MGFKKPKTRKTNKNPLDDDKIERDLDPRKALSGGSKVSKRANKHQQGSDAPKAFQHIMRFMEMKQQHDESKQKLQQQQAKRKSAKPALKGEPQTITDDLNIMPGESISEFDRRVREKMYNNLRLVGTKYEEEDRLNSNPSRDDGGKATVSKRTERKRRNDVIRKQRRLAKKHKDDDDDETPNISSAPRFGEQAEAPPIFKALPKERFKKPVPLPNSREEKNEEKRREELALKNMIQRTARLSPLERLQAKRKANQQSDSAAEKRIAEAEREKAIRRYRMLRAARDSAKSSTPTMS
ncbi:hypothetical protein H4R20_002794 [Coemansia guatemalensis]|uniref:Uncharacterized protein n=1 Tax=Coemansia guatemalensis TaxID=2761395 RepID=A0A9W8LUB3_9FUNG|nr:hypothetical protein H4R20_002794 [Coemansia guatemalensis]